MENYKWIDMFEKLDASVLEDLHLEKDLKKKQRWIRKMFRNGHVKVASIVAAICLGITGALIVVIRVKKSVYKRRTV